MSTRSYGPRGLGDYLNDTFSIIPRIWREALPISCVTVLPAAGLFAVTMSLTSKLIRDWSSNMDLLRDNSAGILDAICRLLLSIAGLSLLQFLGGAYQKAFICLRVGAEFEGRKPRLIRLARKAFGRPWLRVAIQDAVIGLIVGSLSYALVCIFIIPLIAYAAESVEATREYSTALILRLV